MTQQIDPVGKHIEQMYDLQSEREWQRMERHRTEFAVTLRALADHLPPPPARVLDCGGGPGRYAIELGRRGYQVTLFDLSSGNLAMAREKADEAGVSLAGYEHGTATDLSRFPDDRFDAVLLMGPLYHLLDRAQRRQALAEARRVLQPGGVLFAAFVTRYAVPRYAAAYEPIWIVNNAEHLERILGKGVFPLRGQSDTEFVAYFAHPNEVGPMFWAAGFEVRTILGVEGLVNTIEEKVNALSGEDWQRWVDLNYRLAPDPCIHGGVDHLLVVASKPRWRAVLRQIAQQLDETGVAYRVVGGTCPALHGVPLPVRDMDLETNVDGAHRFQDQFSEYVLEPVALREDKVYRSYFGRFDFGGVVVEVMGDLYRREGDAWVPSAAMTETTVDLEGVPVPVSWLEEETLAYIRRGRLERAAQCLPYCDAGRLLQLLRGERATGVL